VREGLSGTGLAAETVIGFSLLALSLYVSLHLERVLAAMSINSPRRLLMNCSVSIMQSGSMWPMS